MTIRQHTLWAALLAVALGATTTGCSEKKKSDIIITHKQSVPVKKDTQKMEEYEQTREVSWVGNTYKVVVKRTADASLPVVKVDDNSRFYDNKISVRVLRSDGSEFFSHTFSKSEFRPYIDVKSIAEGGALLGVVLVKAEGDYLYFAASVGSPDITSDEYVPLQVKVSRMGSLSISRDAMPDGDNGTDSNEKAPSQGDEADEGV